MISVITAAWQDWPGLRRAIASLEMQDCQDWQHVVVSDGPDPELRGRMHARGYAGHGKRVFAELGRNWHSFLGGDGAGQPPGSAGARGARGSRGVTAYRTATHLAAGDLIAYLDQDCEYDPRHLEAHAKTLAATGADFTYTRMRRHIDGHAWDVIGDGNPGHGRIDGNIVVHRAALLRTANWEWGGDADWGLIRRWIDAGARWEFIPEITVAWHHAADDI